MIPSRIRISRESTSQLNALKVRTGLTPNILCRIALCYALANQVSGNVKYDAEGQEFSRSVLFGKYEPVYIALVKQKCKNQGLDSEKEAIKQLILHINYGIQLLMPRIKSLTDLSNLSNTKK